MTSCGRCSATTRSCSASSSSSSRSRPTSGACIPGQPADRGVRRLTEQQERAHRLLLAAQLLLAEVVEGEAGRGAGGALGDDRLAGLGELLEPGGGVDRDAGDDRLAGRRVERRDSFAGVDPGADLHA